MRDAVAHVWLARNALVHCPPGTWLAIVAADTSANAETDLPPHRLVPPSDRAVTRHRIDAKPQLGGPSLFSRDHTGRFARLHRMTSWINVTARRRGRRTDIVLRWLSLEPKVELLAQRLTFIDSLRFPVAIEADWADPVTGDLIRHETFVLPKGASANTPAQAPGSQAKARVPKSATDVRHSQEQLLREYDDPWTANPRPAGAPIIGPLEAGFGDPKGVFAPRREPLRTYEGILREH